MIKTLSLRKSMLQKIWEHDKNEHKNKSYLKDISLFKTHDIFTFKEGINIIYAENGAGKSTLLNMIAVALACEQGGKSLLTSHWLSNLNDTVSYQHGSYDLNLRSEGVGYSSGHFSEAIIMDVCHDGQSALYCDPRKLRGLTHGGAAFDYDFFSDLKVDGKEPSSTGKKNKSRMNDILSILKGESEVKNEPIIAKDKYFDLKEECYKQVLEMISPSFEFGAKTLLIDEPENALDFYSQREFFKLLKQNENRTDIQIIMISHSPLVFGLDNVNFITDNPKKLMEQQELVKNGDFFNLKK